MKMGKFLRWLALALAMLALPAAAYDGLVEKKSFEIPAYTAQGGKTIKQLKVGYETYGTLNADKSNVILIPHFYSSNSHAAGKYKADDKLPGYWDSIIGAGKPIDTDKFFVISVDSLVNLNSKDGVTVTTGPASINPDTGKPYGLSFPVVTITDFVRVQKALLGSLGIKHLYAVGGVSMGALQAYEWAAAYPDMVPRIFPVDGTPAQSAYAVAVLEGWTAPIKVDPNWKRGDYYGGPEPNEGIALAFYNVTVGARSDEYVAQTLNFKWADPKKNPMDALDNEFDVVPAWKAYGMYRALHTTDANNMLYMTKANQLFVPGYGSSVDEGLKKIKARTLVIQARTDLLFPPPEAKAVVETLKKNGTDAQYVELDTPGGHIGGITDIAKRGDAIRDFLSH